jgi:hypothetical protein
LPPFFPPLGLSPQSFTLEPMNEKPINTCPCCGEIKGLYLIKTGDGREWFSAACEPCGMAMNQLDQWTFYVGENK